MTARRITLPKPNPRAKWFDAEGYPTAYYARLMMDWHGILMKNQVATDAAVVASAPPAVIDGSFVPGGTPGTIVYRPTKTSGSGYASPAAAYDGNAATPASAIVSFIGRQERTWSGFADLSGTATLQTLKISSAVESTFDNTDLGSGGLAQLAYSLDRGNTWSTIYASANRANIVDAIDIPLTKKLSDVQVRASDEVYVSGASTAQDIFEIFIEVTP